MADVTPEGARRLADTYAETCPVCADALRSLADQVDRLSAMVRGRERFIEGDSIGRVDFDELCNRVVTREWNALDCELLAGYAQGAYDCMNKYDALKAQVERLEADKRELWGALDSATGLLCVAEHAWEREDYVEHGRINEIRNRFGAAMKGRRG